MAMKNIEDFYPLSPMQQGMLFHSLLEPQSGVYIEQMAVVLRGEINVDAFQKAWQRVIERHSILRTSFLHEGVKEPVQVVHRKVDLPFTTHDWHILDLDEQRVKIKQYLLDERLSGFNLAVAPLMKIGLVKLGEDRYEFIWTHHHILLDGWSIPPLLGEVFTFYDAIKQGKEILLPAPKPFRDYILWLRRQDISQAEIFWKNYLSGVTSPTKFSIDIHQTDLNTKVIEKNRYKEAEVWIPQELTSSLLKLTRKLNITTSTFIQGMWGILLSRYCGEDDILFGVTVSGRPADLPQSEMMIGLLINTLPIRIKINPENSIENFLKELQSQQIEIHQYEYSPLIQIHGWSDIPRGQNIFESIIIFENYPISTAVQSQSGSLVVESYESVEQTNYPLNLIIGATDQVMLKLFYDSNRFLEEIIQHMLGHLKTLIMETVDHPSSSISKLPILTKEEQQKIIFDWNDTQVRYQNEKSILDLFNDQVRNNPDLPAIVYNDLQITYKELDYRSNQIAQLLRTRGVDREVAVGICLDRGFDLIISILGVWKAGGVYLPLDPSYPDDRIIYMVNDVSQTESGLGLILTQNEYLTRFEKTNILTLDIHQIAGEFNHELIPIPCPKKELDDLAYIIYTSGSTGKPKGTMLGHRGYSNFINFHIHELKINSNTRFLQFASMSFDASLAEIGTALGGGGCLVLAERDTLISIPDFICLINERQVTHAILPPTILKLLPSKEVSCLTYIISAGESCSIDIAENWSQDRNFFNGYGPSEATIGPTMYHVKEISSIERYVPIGKPIWNMKCYILDARLNPVPVGVPGEIFIGGVGLSRGYVNRYDLTTNKFIQNPFIPGEKIYRTGDSGRYRTNGVIEFLGRLDDQVKLRGFRIELGEIESVLGLFPEVKNVVVLLREENPGDKKLVAYILLKNGITNRPSQNDFRAHVKKSLPEYMIPSTYIVLDAFPYLPNGKINRRELTAKSGSNLDSEVSSGYEFSQKSPEEEMLASIWEQILGTTNIKVNDNFFDLGGHSLLATQLVSKIRDIFKVELPIRILFEHPELRDLVSQIRKLRDTSDGLIVPTIQPMPRNETSPLSFAQQRLWFLDLLEPGSPNYNLPLTIQLSGEINLEAFKEAIKEIIGRHESLRTSFENVDGVGVQRISTEIEIAIPVDDLRSTSVNQRKEQVLHIAKFEARQPFNLSKGPLIRARLIQVDDKEWFILLNMHHIISDGWSLNILIREFLIIYTSIIHHSGYKLPALPIQYVDFAIWQRTWLRDEVLEKQMGYWRTQLEGTSGYLPLPMDHPRPAIQTFRGSTFSFDLPEVMVSSLINLEKREGVTLFMLLLAVWNILLYRYSGQDDINIGTPIANRNREEIEGIIGFFINTLVLRNDLSGEPTFLELLKRVRDTSLNAYSHQDLPFETIVDSLQPQRDLSHTPLFQVMFILQKNDHRITLGDDVGFVMTPLNIDAGIAKFDLTLTIIDDNSSLMGAFEYNRDLFEDQTIERISSHFLQLINSIVENPEEKINFLEYISDSEKRLLVYDWNNTEYIFEEDLSVLALFDRKVKENPEGTAIKFGELSYSYSQIATLTDRFARYLQKIGIGPEKLVGICLERSPESVISILAVLKAGGAFLPLDPKYPLDRLAYMLEDSGRFQSSNLVLITHSMLLEKIPNQSGIVICIDVEWEAIISDSSDSKQPDSGWITKILPNNLAYVIYTSGSTGKPKGVALEHRGLRNLVEAQINGFKIEPSDRILQFASLSFDASISEIFMALCSGAILYLASQDTLSSLSDLIHLIRSEKITTITLPPSLLSILPSDDLHDLKTLISAGEACNIDIARKWSIQRNMFNAYGPTEATIGPTFYKVMEIPQNITSIPIGKPIPNMQIFVLDKHMQVVPIGISGEILIGGVGLAREYLNLPDRTSEKFVKNPFFPGTRLYKTGDLGRWLPDGNLEYQGRIDQQVKIHGFRIELGEIESVLLQQELVNQAIVLVRQDLPGGNRLVAYIVLKDNSSFTDKLSLIHIFKSYLHGQLPEYMIPAFFEFLEKFPISPNGKVNKNLLPVPAIDMEDRQERYVAPSTKDEKELSKIWSDLLAVNQVSVLDNFFELGGDSIISIQMIARAKDAGIHLNPKQLFKNPTILGLLESIAQNTILADQGVVTGSVPLTPIQNWFFENHLQAPHHWNTSMMLAVFEELDDVMLLDTIRYLITYHDTLRMRYRKNGSIWEQYNAGIEGKIPVEIFALGDLEPDIRGKAIENIAEEIQRSLNLENGPLFKVAYIRFSPGDPSRLLFVFHHLVFDGVSWRIWVDDFQTIYNQLRHQELPFLPPKTTSFKDWAIFLSEFSKVNLVTNDVDKWMRIEQYNSSIPLDFENLPNTYGSSKIISASLSEKETEFILKAVPTLYGTKINDCLVSALARTFKKWTENNSLLLEMEGHGRESLFNNVDLSHTIGWFTSAFPVLIELDKSSDFLSDLKATQAQLNAIPNRGITFGILRYLNPDQCEKFSKLPEPEINFNYLGQFDHGNFEGEENWIQAIPAMESPGMEQYPENVRKSKLYTIVNVTGGILSVYWSFSTNLHKDETIQKLADLYMAELREIIAFSKK